jgi:5-oxoprolinase (ATP-hydrolysing)
VLEQHFPVLLESFSIRRDSGGGGRWRGGNGVARVLRFTDEVSASILSNHRRIAPFGMAGGGEAATGRNSVLRADGSSEILGATATVTLQQGDRLRIETPGGGGFGSADPDNSTVGALDGVRRQRP